jgi:hypothetical protein
MAVFNPRAIPEFLKQSLSAEEGVLGTWLILYPTGQLLGHVAISSNQEMSSNETDHPGKIPLDHYLPAFVDQIWSIFRIQNDASSALMHLKNTKLRDVEVIIMELPAAQTKLVLQRVQYELQSGEFIIVAVKGSMNASFGM